MSIAFQQATPDGHSTSSCPDSTLDEFCMKTKNTLLKLWLDAETAQKSLKNNATDYDECMWLQTYVMNLAITDDERKKILHIALCNTD